MSAIKEEMYFNILVLVMSLHYLVYFVVRRVRHLEYKGHWHQKMFQQI